MNGEVVIPRLGVAEVWNCLELSGTDGHVNGVNIAAWRGMAWRGTLPRRISGCNYSACSVQSEKVALGSTHTGSATTRLMEAGKTKPEHTTLPRCHLVERFGTCFASPRWMEG